jgi:elongator complex protein 1
MSNYYWYLKQAIHFDKSDSLLKFYWDPVQPLVAHYLTSGGLYGRFQFIAEVYVSQSLSAKNPGTVIVVDGNMLKLTPFKFQNVPPPMSSLTFGLSKPACHVSFLVADHGDNICVQTNDGVLSFFESQIKSHKSIQTPLLRGSVQLPDLDKFYYRQATWAEKNTVVAISYDRSGCFDEVAILHIQEKNSTIFISEAEYLRITDDSLSSIRLGPSREILVQSRTGTVFEIVVSSTSDSSFVMRGKLPEFCPWLSLARLENQESLYVGMSGSNRLYLNQKLLSAECTSYFIHNHHLLFTTFSHKLCLLPLNSSCEGLVLSLLKI